MPGKPCRKLVATRDIACGELICLERPLNRGPKPSTRPVCLGCYLPLHSASALCPEGCGWPVCSADCPLLRHEHKSECEHFRSRKFKVEVREDERETRDSLSLKSCARQQPCNLFVSSNVSSIMSKEVSCKWEP